MVALTRIYMIPGIGGSALWQDGFPYLPLWNPSVPGIVASQLMIAGFQRLTMNVDGTSMFPVTLDPPSRFLGSPKVSSLCYGDTLAALRQWFDVVELPYDFRFLPSQIADRFVIDQPGYFLCHSMGCLVGAEIYGRLLASGDAAKALGFIFVGGPIQLNASAETVSIFTDTPNFFKYLAACNWISHSFTPMQLGSIFNPTVLREVISPLQVIVEVLSTWPSLSTLIPNVPDKLVQQSFYEGYRYGFAVRQAWLDKGRDEKIRNLSAASAIPPNKVIEIVGTGIETVPTFGRPADLAGDGVVHNSSSLKPSCVFAIPDGEHRNLADDRRVVDIVKLAIDSNFTAVGNLDLTTLPTYGGQWRPANYNLSTSKTAVFINPTPSQLFDPDP